MGMTRYHPSAPSAGDALNGRSAGRHMGRTGVPVRRFSLDVEDERVKRFVLPVIDDDEIAAILQAAKQHNYEHQEERRRVGPFLTKGVDVLAWMLHQAKRGFFTPSHQQIADALKMGRRTVCRIMKALNLAGFLEWQRRSRKTGEADDTRQASSVYRFNVPASAATLVARIVARRKNRPAQPIRSARVVGDAELSARPGMWEQSLGRGGVLASVLRRLAQAVDATSSCANMALA